MRLPHQLLLVQVHWTIPSLACKLHRLFVELGAEHLLLILLLRIPCTPFNLIFAIDALLRGGFRVETTTA